MSGGAFFTILLWLSLLLNIFMIGGGMLYGCL